jgi:Protein of unknown function (DUF3089)
MFGKRTHFLFCIILCITAACKRQEPARLSIAWQESPIPPAFDYDKSENWAALPDKKDNADLVPNKSPLKDEQMHAQADVFYVHPTIYTYLPNTEFQWNANIQDQYLNRRVDSSAITNQATIFNAAGRIYAPRYRQAHYYAFVTPNKADKDAALQLAYSDVKKAFEYYLKNYNQGRPFIIASHSQGTIHATKLIKEFIDGKELQKQFIAGYLIGIATPKKTFEHIEPCQNANQTGCFIAWTTFQQGYLPEWHPGKPTELVSTNPLTWSLDEQFAPKELNEGGVSYGFKWVKNFADAQNHLGVLWINTPYVFGRSFVHIKNWHQADMNLFYVPIRNNAINRVSAYLKAKN